MDTEKFVIGMFFFFIGIIYKFGYIILGYHSPLGGSRFWFLFSIIGFFYMMYAITKRK